jgi:hypothetical protein
MSHLVRTRRRGTYGIWRSFRKSERQPYHPPEVEPVMAHTTQSPPWLKKKRRRTRNKIAHESRRRNRGS